MVDTPETFAFKLERAAARAPAEVAKVMVKAAFNIRDDWAERWSGLRHAPKIARSITFDVWTTPFATIAEIGPDKSRRGLGGALGNLFEYGSVNNAPFPGGGPALAKEAPNVERFIAEAVEDLF